MMRSTLQKYMPVALGLEEATTLTVEEVPTTDNPEQPTVEGPTFDKPVEPLPSELGPVELVIGRNGDGMDFVKPEQTQAEIESALMAQPPANANPDMRLPTSEEPGESPEPAGVLGEVPAVATETPAPVTEEATPVAAASEAPAAVVPPATTPTAEPETPPAEAAPVVEPTEPPAEETPPVEDEPKEPKAEEPPKKEEKPEEEEEEDPELEKPKAATEHYGQAPLSRVALNKWIADNVSVEEFPNTGDRSHLSAQTLIDVPLDHQPNPADPIPETIAEVPSTEDVSDDDSLDHAMVAQDAIADEMTEMEDLGTSLEGYIELITQARTQGGITKREAGFMRLGLEMLETKLGVRAMTPGLEAYDGPASSDHASTISLEVLGGMVKDVYKALQHIWRELRIFLGTAWNELTNGVGRLVEDAKALRMQVDGLVGVPNLGEFEITGTQLAFANGHFVAQNPVVIAGLAAYVSQEYPKELKAWLSDLAKALASINMLSAESIHKAVKAVQSMGSHTSGSHSVANRFRGDHFPGNYWLTTTNDMDSFSTSTRHFAAMGGTVAFKVNSPMHKGLHKVVEPPSRFTIKVGTPSELKRRAGDIVKIIEALNTIKNHTTDLSRELDTLEKVSEAAAKLVAGVQQSGAAPSNVQDLVNLINGCTRAARMGTTNFNQVYYYVVRVLKTNMAILKQEVAQYQ